MPKEDSTAKKVAEYLLQIKAIKLEPKNPFIWASGWQSPIYCDNRITLSYPNIRRFLSLAIANEIKRKYPETKAIAGVATGAIGLGMLVAETLDLPFIYVRPQPKKHGRQNQIEGQYDIYAPTVVVEDLISTGKSSLQAIDALRNANINVLGMLALFSYEFDIAEANMKEAEVELTTLSGYNTLIETAVATGYIEPQQEEVLKQWRKTPAHWSPK
jgi:orotate phosphoribosyltransferase|tara:strand:- start:18259 stop:18903 length:645 start_codon:yes stop_codon:yes gene_type:complete